MASCELSPLALATTDELIEELKGRVDACLVATLRSDKNSDLFFVDYKGLTVCVGLAERAKAKLIEHCLSPGLDLDGSEEV